VTLSDSARAALASANQMSQESRRRSRGIASATLTAVFGKGTSLLVSAATVPLTVRYLGAEGYGLWITISSAATMFFVLDIGIANTLTNLISEAYAGDDKERAATYFATAFWLVVGIAALLGLGGWILWPFVHWVSLFHVQDPALVQDTSYAMAAAFIVFLLALPTGLASKVLGGYQELHASNLFAAGGSVLSLLVVIAVVYLHGSLPILVAGFAGSAVAANAACLFWICLFHKPWMMPWPRLISAGCIGRIFRSGTQFFAIQIAALVIFSSDNLVISHYLSPAQVTPYAVTWRLVGYITAVQATVLPALWPAYAEAYAKGHLQWIRSTYNQIRWLTCAALAVGCLAMLFAGREIIRIWAGAAAVPNALLIRLMCVWIVISAFTFNQSCLMGATFRVTKQAIASSLAGVANLSLSILWVKTMGPAGVILGTIVSYLIFIVAVQAWEVRKILRGDFAPLPEAAGPGTRVTSDKQLSDAAGVLRKEKDD
jgi:O-antigen/teichoic acid export membrane protein